MTPTNLKKSREQSAIDALSDGVQQRLAAVLDQYLQRLENGDPPSPEQLFAEHPDLAESLRTYLDSLQFLHRATAEEAKPAVEEELEAPKQGRLGEFRLVREIGRGGMGIVYEAQQESLGRTVALKVLPFAAVLDKKQIARFTNEAQAAAQLHHENIVPVYSVGCDRGVHFYSMQFIDGRPLDRAISDMQSAGQARPLEETPEKHFSPDTDDATDRSGGGSTLRAFSTAHSFRSRSFIRSAVELTIQIAEALEHAHQFGVIHRDVKPSNILIDESGKPWITDFGLARIQSSANMTMTGDILGTARYMSPEQATGQGSLVDQRTDVYSLGITLYELLTLRYAFAGAERDAILQKIAQEEPLRPRRINSSIPVDLETVLLKAIAKQRDQRYETALDFAADLRRFLDGKPTLAKRPSLIDRAGKWAARHRGLVAAVAALLLLTLIGTTISSILIGRALKQAQDNYAESEAQRGRATKYLDQARQLVHGLGDYAEQLQHVPGAEPIRAQLLSETLRYHKGFIEDAGDDPSLQLELAVTYAKTADLTEQIGDKNSAVAQYQEAVDLFQTHLRNHPDDTKAMANLALSWNNLGLLENNLGQADAAGRAFRDAIQIQERLIDLEPDVERHRADLASSHNNLGLLHSGAGELADAEAAYREAVRLQEEYVRRHPRDQHVVRSLAVSYNNLGFLASRDRPAQARKAYQQAIDLQQGLLQSAADNVDHRIDLARTYNNLGMLHRQQQQLEDARAAYQKSLELLREAHGKAPLRTDARRDLAVSYNNLARIYSSLEQHQQAGECLRQAQSGFERLLEDFPQALHFHSSLGGVFNNLGMALEQQDRLADAAEAYHSAMQHQRVAWRLAPQVADFRELLNKHYFNYGRVLRELNEPRQAAEVAWQRKELWSGEPGRLFSVAEELALAAAKIEDAEAKIRWTGLAIETLAEAKQAGLVLDEQRLSTAELASLREEPAFRQLVRELNATTSDHGTRP